MKVVLLVGLGGCIGSIARYKLSGWVLQHATDWRFPMGTFVVNVFGCLLAGAVSALAVRGEFSSDAKLFLFTGLLGGFTTFSAFGLETTTLLKRNEFGIALAYVALSVFCGILGIWFGMKAFPTSALN